jgi:replicative DNA helicase
MKDNKLEKAVLGAMLLDPSAISSVIPILKEEFFDDPAHRYIFRAVKSLYAKSDTIDLLTVTGEVRKTGRLQDIGGAHFISALTYGVASANNIEAHVRKLNEIYILRELHSFGQVLTQQAQIPSTDCFDLIAKVSEKIAELTAFTTNSIQKVGEIFAKMVDEIKQVQESGKPPGVLSGLANLDKITGGFQKGALYVIAARPGMGKTAFALGIAKTPAFEFKRGVAFFSLEMTAMELVGRVASSESEVSATKINQRNITHAELTAIGGRCHRLLEAPLFIDDTPALRVIDLKAKARRLVYEHNVELIIVDYLQLMHGEEKGNREQEISYISRSMKTLAKELSVPVIALSQLSRKVEERTDKRPMLSDLRESGAIEQDADVVAFLFRPEYYDLDPNGYDYNGNTLPTANLLLFDVAKGRGLPIGEVPLKFYGEFMRVDNYELVPYSGGNSLSNNQAFLT